MGLRRSEVARAITTVHGLRLLDSVPQSVLKRPKLLNYKSLDIFTNFQEGNNCTDHHYCTCINDYAWYTNMAAAIARKW